MDRYDLEPSGEGRVEQASIGQRQEGLQGGRKGESAPHRESKGERRLALLAISNRDIASEAHSLS